LLGNKTAMQRVPISVLGIPVAFVTLAASAVWGNKGHTDRAVAGLIAGMALLAICTVWTSTSILRRGRVYQWLRPESRPRRWILILLLIDFAIFCVWFPVWMMWPAALVSRALALLFGLVFFVVGITIKWFTPAVDRLVTRAGWQLR
jgi:hypothetical protein